MGIRCLLCNLLFALSLAACGGASSAGGLTTQRVFDQLQRVGLATNAQLSLATETYSPIGRCGDRLQFDIPGAPVGAYGMILACPIDPSFDLSTAGDAVLYRSEDGSINVLVVGAPAIAPRIGEQVQRIRE